jgi:hypothetical protein
MKDKNVFYLRKFLNKKGHHSNAFIYAEISKNSSPSKNKKKENIWRDSELKIGDCDRIVNLSMDLNSINATLNSIHKLDILIDTLKAFKRAFIKEVNLMRKGK